MATATATTAMATVDADRPEQVRQRLAGDDVARRDGRDEEQFERRRRTGVRVSAVAESTRERTRRNSNASAGRHCLWHSTATRIYDFFSSLSLGFP
ncbi:hypothetical protein C9J85_02775 [Haloferax sp. wsp5]|nr:hypothetical protein C9J85_02775 [Haloferax sp. wsp5]